MTDISPITALTGELVTIDCGRRPETTRDCMWIREEHDQLPGRYLGVLPWNPRDIRLYSDPRQREKSGPTGFDLMTRLRGMPVLPANVMDFLLEHPFFIPDSWLGKNVWFWGTQYYTRGGMPAVRCLSASSSVATSEGLNLWGFNWLGHEFLSSDVAAVLVE